MLEVSEHDVAVTTRLAQGQEVTGFEFEIREEVERVNMVHLKLVSGATRCASRVPLQVRTSHR